MKGRTTTLLLLICTACLWAEVTSTSMKYEFWAQRDVSGTLTDVYFATPTGTPLSNGSYLPIDLESTISDIQFLVAVDNNLLPSSGDVTITLTLGRFKHENDYASKNPKFRGGYVLAVWKYKPVTIPVDTGEEDPEYWTFQAQPSTLYQPNTFGAQGQIQANTPVLESEYLAVGRSDTNNKGNDNNPGTVTWTADKTNHPLGESRIWYYAVGLQFSGPTSEYGTLNDLASYPPGGEVSAEITLTVTGP